MSAIIVLLILAVLYFLPTLVAAARNKRNTGAIFALNLLLGWTLLGWIGAIVWSFTYETPQPREVY